MRAQYLSQNYERQQQQGNDQHPTELHAFATPAVWLLRFHPAILEEPHPQTARHPPAQNGGNLAAPQRVASMPASCLCT